MMVKGGLDTKGRLSIILMLTGLWCLYHLGTDPVLAQEKEVVASNTIEVVGMIKQPFTLKTEDLKQMESIELKDTVMVGSHAGFMGMNDYRGVPLKSILDRAGLGEKVKGLVIVVSATDGFYVTLSWGEIYNTLCGDKIILAYEKDGKPLGASEGFVRLIIPYDSHVADRAVKWVNRIEVKDAGK
jgi:DMSO/TMAO reductase YedYZ molybdopterin-dependent catalytic subunit